LLVGVERSGTPIHDHPTTVAWNALLVGCKLWCCLPPDVDEKHLLLNLEYDLDQENNDSTADDSDIDIDSSAIDWFFQCACDNSTSELPESAKMIVQHPGDVVYLPAGWFHVVLNIETSTAISVSLALRRDLRSGLPALMESDEEFATFWIDRLLQQEKNQNSNGSTNNINEGEDADSIRPAESNGFPPACYQWSS